MSMSWHNFFFAAFDPAGTITVDKLPGAFWVQALSVRLFGVHAWALVAPQVLEGMASVLVLYRVVRRLAGPVAGDPRRRRVRALARDRRAQPGQHPRHADDPAGPARGRRDGPAAISGRLRSLVWAGVLVGLAFQAKMIEAWLVLPALALAYLVAAGAPGGGRSRPARYRRPRHRRGLAELDGRRVSVAGRRAGRTSTGAATNSVFSQVFVYNGFGRVDQASPNQLLTRAIGLKLGSPAPGWDRLLTGAVGRDTALADPGRTDRARRLPRSPAAAGTAACSGPRSRSGGAG